MSIYVAGHQGMVGSAIIRRLKMVDYKNIITATRKELDLTNQLAVKEFFQNQKIDYVVLAAAKVGGIYANNAYPAEFIYQNLMIQSNIIHEAYQVGVQRLLFLGSSCIYPRQALQPMKEEYLLSGCLESTNEPYAIAKIAGIKMCESYNRQYGTQYRAVMPTNLYGPNDNFDLENSHVIPALIRKFYEAKNNNQNSVEIWGSGQVRREFLHVDDLADACVHLMCLEDQAIDKVTSFPCSHINIGMGKDIAIAELAELIKEISCFQGKIKYDGSKPDGSPQKLLDISRIKSLNWFPTIHLSMGLKRTYDWYCQNIAELRLA